MMKICSKCHLYKEISCFNKVLGRPGKYSSWCKECKAALSRLGRGIISKRPYKPKRGPRPELDNIRRFVLSRKIQCVKCGESDKSCLDFHHIKDKLFHVNTVCVNKHSVEEIEAEMAKCVVLCSNCHRKLHAGKISL